MGKPSAPSSVKRRVGFWRFKPDQLIFTKLARFFSLKDRMGVLGLDGAMAFYRYTIPGLAANIYGSALRYRYIFYFRLPFVPLVLALSVAAVSGSLGRISAYRILKTVSKIKGATG